jgi:hypothetical protein
MNGFFSFQWLGLLPLQRIQPRIRSTRRHGLGVHVRVHRFTNTVDRLVTDRGTAAAEAVRMTNNNESISTIALSTMAEVTGGAYAAPGSTAYQLKYAKQFIARSEGQYTGAKVVHGTVMLEDGEMGNWIPFGSVYQ